jgi:pSer/pThr/pTyr-binding forkhead associated (FHA) protein
MDQPQLHQHSPLELKQQLEAERRGFPFVVYRDADGQQQIIELGDRERLTVGRSAASDLCLAWDGDVSRVHAAFERIGDQWTLVDDGVSRNGSFVNSERIQGRRRLADSDRVRFGKTILIFRAPVGGRGETTLESDDVVAAAKLTEAQRRVLIALARPYADGRTFATPAGNQAIAKDLYLSIAGVKTHLRTLFEKFGVEDLPQNQKRARLVELALQSGAITERDLTADA